MKDINEKQIEEMTSEVKNFKERTRYLFGWDGRSKDEIFATLLLEAGYRKQSDTVRDFVDRIAEFASAMRLLADKEYEESRLVKAMYAQGKLDAIGYMIREIKKLAEEYEAEVEEC